MEDSKSFSDFILQKFYEYGNKVAMKNGDSTLTYSDMINEIELLNHKIKKARLTSVAICIENKLNQIVLAMACMISGVPFIVIDRSNPISFLKDVLDEANVTCYNKVVTPVYSLVK